MSTSNRVKRAGAVAFIVAVLLLGLTAVASAQEVVPTVSITGTTAAFGGLPFCPGHPGGPIDAGSVTLTRTGATDEALSVDYDVARTAGDYQGTAVFAAGSATVKVPVDPVIRESPVLDLTLVLGDAYAVGDPASVHIPVVINPVDPTAWCAQFVSTTTSTTTEVTPNPSTSTTVTSPGSTVLATGTKQTTVGSQAELPRTGADDVTGLVAVALSLLGSGGLLLVSRRRS